MNVSKPPSRPRVLTKKKVSRVRPTPPCELFYGLRFALGLTQNDVATRSEGLITRNVIASLETRRGKLSIRETFRGVCKGLGVTEDELDALIARHVSVEDLAARVLEREPNLRDGAERAAARTKAKG